jgi:putative peptidoglycan lipid II flippase
LEQRSFFKSNSHLTLLTVVGILINFFTQTLVAYYFGANFTRDSYFLAQGIPNYLNVIFINSLIVIFLPHFIALNKEDVSDGLNFFINFTFFILFIVGIISCLTITFSTQVISVIYPTLNSTEVFIISKILMVLLLANLFQIGGNLLAGIYQNENQFLISSLQQILTGIFSIMLVFAFHKILAIESLAYGVLLGSIINFLILLFNLRKINIRLNLKTVKISLLNKEVVEVIKVAIPLLVANIIMRSNVIFEKVFAANLPEGSISHLGYATQIILILSTISSSGIATIIFPVLTNLWIENDIDRLLFFFYKSFRIILLITVSISTIFVAFGDIFIKLVFERGAFNHNDTIIVYLLILWLLGYFIAGSMGNLLGKIFYFSKNTKSFSIAGIIEIILYLVFAYFLSKEFGVFGLASSLTISSLCNIVIQIVVIKKIILPFEIKKLASEGIKILFSGLALLLCLVISNYLLTFLENPFIRSATCVLACLPIYLIFLVKVFKIEETIYLYHFVKLKLIKLLK